MLFRAHARNDTDAPVTLVLHNRCPQIDVDFTGFPGSFLPDGSCTMGPCPEQPPLRYTMEPGVSVTLAEVSTPVGSETTCSDDIGVGTYRIGFRAFPLEESTAQLCEVETAELLLRQR